MIEIYRSLKTAEVWIYIFLAVCAVFPVRTFVSSIQEYRSSVFGMEKDNARGKIFQSSSLFVLLIILAIGEFIFVSVADNKIATVDLLSTPTLNLESTLTPQGTPVPGATPQLTTSTPANSAFAGGCAAGKIEWSFPAPGADVSGIVELKGSVNIPNFGIYKYEYSQDNTQWTTIQAGRTVVVNGVIGNWDTSVLTSGDYFLRLIASDNTGLELAPCILAVRVIQK